MKKFFYLMAATAVLVTNPLKAMDESDYVADRPNFSIKAAQLSQLVKSKKYHYGQVVHIHNGYPDGITGEFRPLALKDGYICIKIDSDYEIKYLHSNNSGENFEKIYLEKNAFSSERVRNTEAICKNNPEIKLDPDEDIHFSWQRNQYFMAPFPGWEPPTRYDPKYASCDFTWCEEIKYVHFCKIFFQTEAQFLQKKADREEFERRCSEERIRVRG